MKQTHLPGFGVALLLLLGIISNEGCKSDSKANEITVVFDSSVVRSPYDFNATGIAEAKKELFKIDKADSTLFARLQKYIDTVVIHGKTYYLIEGDLLVTQEELAYKIMERKIYTKLAIRGFQETVIGYNVTTQDTIKWKHFPIRYAIDKASFVAANANYDSIRQRMNRAATQWEKVCNVRFVYDNQWDNRGSDALAKVDFIVTCAPQSQPSFVATAFFPNDPTEKHYLTIYEKYWTSPYDATGIFRHEIGHILGFKHEHAYNSRAVPISCRGDTLHNPEWMDPNKLKIGTYDKISLMHYYCGGAGNLAFTFSHFDTIAYKSIYP